ncbi:MAG: hypothetical protein HC903_20085 [Methylacidiphilales bacterium]|nr:hypothetical protein [Candidatus Methylacidiphilales bacterium]NJR15547.1 hypothetical protein [Calothrix sp. CSU_2_0]
MLTEPTPCLPGKYEYNLDISTLLVEVDTNGNPTLANSRVGKYLTTKI